MLFNASVDKKGAILLGKYVACDSFHETRPLRVVTHVHADHILGLERSLKSCEQVLMTAATKDLIKVIKPHHLMEDRNVKTLDYGERFLYDDEELTLHPADHILGAAQVIVKDKEGTRMLFTGDFRLRGTPVVSADALVIEATYGHPFRVRHFQNEVEKVLITLVERGLRNGPVFVFGYYGKLQEAMKILRERGVSVPFVVPKRIFCFSKVCERYGMFFGDGLELESDEVGGLLLREKAPCVVFHHTSSRKRVGLDGFRVLLSGWQFGGDAVRRVGDCEFVVGLSDHSDFFGLLRYVELCGASLVVVDGFRSNCAKTFAKEVRERLGVEAYAMP
jgi:putative mRNA 3-end processing factor